MKTKSNWIVKSIALLCVLLMTFGLFAGCNAECEHKYKDGVCTLCNTACPHREYENGKCKECGLECEHDYNKQGECKVCGTKCAHEEYADGECAECGKVCLHAEYENGMCKTCGTACPHAEYENGACKTCGTACPHAEYVNSVCKVCGINCEHKVYEDGICKACNYVCKHAKYENGACKTCGKVCAHTRFYNGKCVLCGIVCAHENYENGVCKVCGTKCVHNYGDSDECLTCKSPKFPEFTLPTESSPLPRISVVTAGGEFPDATRSVSFDNNNPANNVDWQYSDCIVTVDNCDEAYEISATGGFKVRGNWTTTYDKKPFRIKFDKKQPMLGLNGGEKIKSWVLLADYKDSSLERNSVAFYLAKEILGADGYYSSDFRQVELYLNGSYWGVYLLAEQQQTNKNRIDVTEPEDGYLGTDIGYFIEYDGYYNLELYNERFSCDYGSLGSLRARNGSVKHADMNGFTIKSDVYENTEYAEGNSLRYPQKTFIKNYIYNLYTLCYNAVYNHTYYTFNSEHTALVDYVPETANPVYETVSQVIDIRSLVDTYILNEIACDADIGWSSFFMDVDFGPEAKDNLLRFEAPWDFDSAFGFKANTCESGEGLFAANSSNPWLIIFINEDWFWNMVKDKWQTMTAAEVQQDTLAFIQDLRYNYAEAYERNFDRWGFRVNGEATWWNQEYITCNLDAVDQLLNWLDTRFNYLDSIWSE